MCNRIKFADTYFNLHSFPVVLIEGHFVLFEIPLSQVYKYQEKVGRVVFGPDMAILGPHEDFNVLSLSGKHWI